MKRARAAAICIASAIALYGCAARERPSPSAAAFAEAIPLCALLANPRPHVGKKVLVRGYLTQNPHGREFMDEDCDRGVLPLDHLRRGAWTETPRARRLRLRFNAYAERFRGRPPWVPAVYSGIFTDHSPALIAFADSFSLESAELVAVGRPDLRERSRGAD
jgi:hypothetical protein